MATTGSLQGRTAIITGATGGLGGAIARLFAEHGARLLLVGRNQGSLEKLRADLAAEGAAVDIIVADITQARSADAIVAAAVAVHGSLDILVNCAGVFLWRPFLELDLADWQRTLATNLSAPFTLTQAAARRFVTQGQGGCVINIASLHGTIAEANAVPQCAAKLGVVGLTRATAEALRPHGVRVNAIAPGSIAPDSDDELSSDLMHKITQADVAHTALFLASDGARGLTGTVIDAHGISRPVTGTR